jgi:hypothetical protein
VTEYKRCEHGPRIPRWDRGARGMWAGLFCPVRECQPIWVNDIEVIYDAWAAWMQMEIHSGTVAAETAEALGGKVG